MNEAEIISIIKECLNGKKECFGQIISHFQKQIFNLCLHLLGTPQDAEDATMEIFIKVYNSLPSFKTSYKFSTWIFKIAVNHLNDILRKRKREEKYLFTEFSNRKNRAELRSPENVFFRKSEERELKKALKSIPIKYQTALMLKYYYELSYQQISEIMDIPTNTVGSLIFRGKNELREKLKEMGV
ncbi:MAG: RNA polymerase sigma factor [Candidatus Aminicenantia bacterium]